MANEEKAWYIVNTIKEAEHLCSTNEKWLNYEISEKFRVFPDFLARMIVDSNESAVQLPDEVCKIFLSNCIYFNMHVCPVCPTSKVNDDKYYLNASISLVKYNKDNSKITLCVKVDITPYFIFDKDILEVIRNNKLSILIRESDESTWTEGHNYIALDFKYDGSFIYKKELRKFDESLHTHDDKIIRHDFSK